MKKLLSGIFSIALLAACGQSQPSGVQTASSLSQVVTAQGVKKLASFDERAYKKAPSLSFIETVDGQFNEPNKKYIGEKYQAKCFIIAKSFSLIPPHEWAATLHNPDKDIDFVTLKALSRTSLTRNSGAKYYEELGASYQGGKEHVLVTVYMSVQERTKRQAGVAVDAIKLPDGTYVMP
ncbi:MAG TPA: hypothetical protein V6D00_02230 [Pantanalinema sp.]